MGELCGDLELYFVAIEPLNFSNTNAHFLRNFSPHYAALLACTLLPMKMAESVIQ